MPGTSTGASSEGVVNGADVPASSVSTVLMLMAVSMLSLPGVQPQAETLVGVVVSGRPYLPFWNEGGRFTNIPCSLFI